MEVFTAQLKDLFDQDRRTDMLDRAEVCAILPDVKDETKIDRDTLIDQLQDLPEQVDHNVLNEIFLKYMFKDNTRISRKELIKKLKGLPVEIKQKSNQKTPEIKYKVQPFSQSSGGSRLRGAGNIEHRT
jgi:hypothetical protein